ncbi:MAG: PP2C family protein-serine/threonine phosphatase [Candidatus Gracilibacteria bacterium]|nr:PP2C family protein-serine/threonine phosphatase [Candidatus Gracilibacteria bacterium]MDD3119958.1 PP2C family protein-serine/threonine phosphatase [Candidatus Gracilibacteria bacterium]MDD4529934.1 PP2C family protein-serine/threonine phosphatase [Candidatus Gracilibacteria bacterium]
MFAVLIFLISGVDIYLFLEYKDLIIENMDISFYVIIGELIVILFAYFQIIFVPLKELSGKIALFLTGSESGKIKKRIFNNDIKFITSFLEKILELIKNFKEELLSGRELKGEVQLAAEVQKHVLKEKVIKIPSLEYVAKTKSATEVGGDSYDIIQSGNNYYIYIGDATGHGVAAGFIMMMTNALISAFSKAISNSAQILANTNEILKPRIKPNTLMTLLMLRWNEQDRKMYMAGAGHENLIVYKASSQKAFKVQSGGIALGMTKDISKILKELQISIEPGDILVMYTDGITEARNSSKESSEQNLVMMFGVEKIMEATENAGIKSAQGVFNSITSELSRFMGYNHKQFDDITLIVIKYKESSEDSLDLGHDVSKEFLAEWNWQ